MKTLVLITSVIKPCTNAFINTDIRSIFTHEERFEQTKKTIASVRKKIPDAKIFIIECSDIEKEIEVYLKQHTDYFLNVYDIEIARQNTCDRSKSLGEGTLTALALDYILNNIEFDTLIKLSGRYWLSDVYTNSSSTTTIKYILKNVCTIFYKLPKNLVSEYLEFLLKRFSQMKQGMTSEELFAIFIQQCGENITSVKTLGVEGYNSIDGKLFRT